MWPKSGEVEFENKREETVQWNELYLDQTLVEPCATEKKLETS